MLAQKIRCGALVWLAADEDAPPFPVATDLGAPTSEAACARARSSGGLPTDAEWPEQVTLTPGESSMTGTPHRDGAVVIERLTATLAAESFERLRAAAPRSFD
jgi:hypothetical protein